MSIHTEYDSYINPRFTELHIMMLVLAVIICASLLIGYSSVNAFSNPAGFIGYGITGILVFIVIQKMRQITVDKLSNSLCLTVCFLGILAIIFNLIAKLNLVYGLISVLFVLAMYSLIKFIASNRPESKPTHLLRYNSNVFK